MDVVGNVAGGGRIGGVDYFELHILGDEQHDVTAGGAVVGDVVTFIGLDAFHFASIAFAITVAKFGHFAINGVLGVVGSFVFEVLTANVFPSGEFWQEDDYLGEG